MTFSRKHCVFWTITLAATLSLQCSGSESTSGKTESTDRKAESTDRRAEWAKPLEKPGLPNLHEVAPGIYRGAQPDEEGFRSLKAMGVKTVINLRNLHSDKDELEDSGQKGAIGLVEIPMNAHSVKEEDIIQFLKIATDKSKQPFFFHCKHGSDRTGTMAASYRIIVQGWSKEDAIQEMKEGGFGFHEIWANLPKLIQNFDVEKIKKAL